jgi:hypothetical protein
MYIHAYGHQPAGDLGWFIDTKIGTFKTPAGHEILTKRAARGVVKNTADLTSLIAGVRRPDFADPQDHIKLGEQKRHFLRSIKQPPWTAWFSAIDHLQALHQSMMASTNRTDQFRLIGEALHLIHDSFAPAHVEREPSTGDVLNIRVYDPKAGPNDHAFLTDPRDAIFSAQPPNALAIGAQRAVSCSKEYLQMALRHLQFNQSTLLAPLSLPQQTKWDLHAFISRRLWFRFPDLTLGAQGWPVSVLHGSLNNWLVATSSKLPSLQGSSFASDTRTAVLDFQNATTGLTPTGVVDRQTWKKLLLP